MRTKTLFAIAACALCAATASAQSASEKGSLKSRIQYGVRVGMNVANMKYSDKESDEWFSCDDSGSAGSRVGFNIGAIVDIPVFKDYLYVQPGLYFTQKGFKSTEKYEGYKIKTVMNPTYLEIPILLSGRYTVGKKQNAQLQVNFGPYFAVGLGGKEKETSEGYGETEKSDCKIFVKGKEGYYNEATGDYVEGSYDLGYKRFDFGLSVGAGVLLYKHYFVGFQYEFGLVNMLPDWSKGSEDDSSWEYKLKNRNFMLSVGYNF